MFVNPAASSAGQDYTIGNVILLPLAFAWAFYLATTERQRRLTESPSPAHNKT
jgi:hypothetical protein